MVSLSSYRGQEKSWRQNPDSWPWLSFPGSRESGRALNSGPPTLGALGHHRCSSQSSTQPVPALTLAGYPESFCFSWTEEAPLGASLCHLALWGDCHFWTINHQRGVSREHGPEISTLQFGSVAPTPHCFVPSFVQSFTHDT